MRGLCPVAASRGHSSSRCAGLTIAASLVAEHRLQTRRLSSRGSRAQLLCGMWDLPRPGLEPVCPELAGRFSTTAPPGKPHSFFISFISLLLFFKSNIYLYIFLKFKIDIYKIKRMFSSLVFLIHSAQVITVKQSF